MSFDLHFQPYRFDGTTEKRVNPFTKQVADIPRNEPLSASEVAAVRAVFERAGATGDADAGKTVRFSDGGSAEIYDERLETGCMFAIRGAGITPLVAQLLFDVLIAGNWVLMESGEDDVVIAPSLECLKGSPKNFGRVVVAASAGEVSALLSGGFEAWKKYRSSVGHAS